MYTHSSPSAALEGLAPSASSSASPCLKRRATGARGLHEGLVHVWSAIERYVSTYHHCFIKKILPGQAPPFVHTQGPSSTKGVVFTMLRSAFSRIKYQSDGGSFFSKKLVPA